jgi:hypothetical protein
MWEETVERLSARTMEVSILNQKFRDTFFMEKEFGVGTFKPANLAPNSFSPEFKREASRQRPDIHCFLPVSAAQLF